MFDLPSFSFHCVPELAENIEVCLEIKSPVEKN